MDCAATKFQFNTTVKLLVINVAALMAIGLLMVYSASLSINPDEHFTLFTKQIIFVPAALVAMMAAMWFPYHRLNRRWVAVGLLVVSLAAVVGVLFLGHSSGGARRWYQGPFDLKIQPSEVAKLTAIVFFAWFLSRDKAPLRHYLKTFLCLVGVLGAVCALIAYQDLGTASLVALVCLCVMLAGGVPWWHPLTFAPAVAAAGYVFVTQYAYRLQRLTTYLDPWSDPRGAGYQITQSLMAIGSGGWFGLGLGNGVQKLQYLPEDTTDFIFSVICEEMGFVGGALVILLFLTLTLLGLRVARHAPNRFGYLLSLGIILWIGFQAAINIGVATGALPTKGIALPLVSYGGSGLLLTGTALGLLMSVAARSPALSAVAATASTELPTPMGAVTPTSSASEPAPQPPLPQKSDLAPVTA
jgi:cell division protein FtsW